MTAMRRWPKPAQRDCSSWLPMSSRAFSQMGGRESRNPPANRGHLALGGAGLRGNRGRHRCLRITDRCSISRTRSSRNGMSGGGLPRVLRIRRRDRLKEMALAPGFPRPGGAGDNPMSPQRRRAFMLTQARLFHETNRSSNGRTHAPVVIDPNWLSPTAATRPGDTGESVKHSAMSLANVA